MKSKASFLAMVALAAGSLLGAATGCELLANVDRNKIDGSGGAGAATTQGGGGTVSQGGGGTTSGPNCVDPKADCNAPTDPCKVAACDAAGECVVEDAADGTPAGTQTDGDCKESVCKAGVVGSQNDDDDPLDDANACTTDTCDMGSPKSTPTGSGTACMGTQVCDGMGECVECVGDGDCTDPLKSICDQNVCVNTTCGNMVKDPNETDKDCGGACAPCDDLKECLVPGDCQSGVCTGMVCQVPTCTDDVPNGVETDKDCGGNSGCPKCAASKGCDANADCIGDQCTGMAGTCVPNCVDTEKNNAETDADCGGGTCGTCAVGKDCAGSDANCATNAFCDAASKCADDLPNGQMCAGVSQCVSGLCVDGVCCNMACGGLCQACNNGGNEGSCSNVANGQDPAAECAGAEFCNGGGACSKAMGATCVLGGECTSGFCADGVCCNAACSGTCKSCLAIETGSANGACGNITASSDPANECAGVLNCAAGGVCASPLAQGAACTVGGECASGPCVDGFCCASACTLTCTACSMVKTGMANGTCAAVSPNTDPDNDCAGPLSCDGNGACLKANGAACAGAAECGSNFCVDMVCCNSDCIGSCRSCNGANGSTAGTCSLHPAGADNGNECSGGGMADCNGGGSCGLGASGAPCVGAGGVCAGGNCNAGVCP